MIYPKKLKQGDTVAIVAPAGKLVEGTLSEALRTLRNWKLEVVLGTNLQKGHYYFSGSDIERLNDIQMAIDNPEVKAIFCARGGYGTTRILDKIDFTSFQNTPKWIVGFSDITALHFQVHKMGVTSIHSVMPTGFGRSDPDSIEGLRKILFGEPLHYEVEADAINRNGKVVAPIVGGNLSLIVDSLGTASEIDFDNKIVFIEEIDEYLYKIDRMMVQLKRAGKLRNLAGFIVGHMTDMKDTNVPFGKNANELIFEHVAEYNYPLAFNIPIGHEFLNLAIPCSYECLLNINNKTAYLSFK